MFLAFVKYPTWYSTSVTQDSSSIVGSVHYSQTGNSELPDSVKYSLFNLGRLVTPLVCGVRKVPAATYVVEQACNIPSLSESTKRRSDAAGYYIHGAGIRFPRENLYFCVQSWNRNIFFPNVTVRCGIHLHCMLLSISRLSSAF